MSGYWRATDVTLGKMSRGGNGTLPYKEDVTNRQGGCVLDPHGVLYDNMVRWLASYPMLTKGRKIHLIDPTSEVGRVGFNPLGSTQHTTLAGRVDSTAAAIAQVWGEEDTTKTPRLKKILRAVLYVLALRNLTLLEAPKLTHWSREQVRDYLTANLPRSIYQDVWADLNAFPPRLFIEHFESVNNRLMELLSSPALESILGQNEHTLDLRQAMDDGDIILVRLVPKGDLTEDNARTLGALLINQCFLTARGRAADVSRPFYLYVDEAYEYLTGDIERAIVQTRKFGLHVVLAHHFLEQLRSRGDNIFAGVMNAVPTKVVFGVSYDDALEMVNRLFPGRIHPDRIKHVMDKPVAVGLEKDILRGHSESAAVSETDNPDVLVSGSTEQTSGEHSAHATHTSRSHPTGPTITHTVSYSDSWQEAYRTIYEVMPMATYSLDDMRHMEATGVMDQKSREAIVKLPSQSAVNVITPEVEGRYGRVERVATFIQKTMERSYCTSSPNAITDEINHREMKLLTDVKQYILRDDSDDSEPDLLEWG